MSFSRFFGAVQQRCTSSIKAVGENITRAFQRVAAVREQDNTSDTSSSSSGSYVEYNPNRNTNLVFKSTFIQVPDRNEHPRREICFAEDRILGIIREIRPNAGSEEPHSVVLHGALRRTAQEQPHIGLRDSLYRSIVDIGASGSSEFTITGLMRDGAMRGVSVGESRMIVLRGGTSVHKTPQNTMAFKMPLSSMEVLTDWLEMEEYDFDLNEGDVLVFGSAGFWDNVEVERVEEMVNRSIRACANFGDQLGVGRTSTSKINIMFRRVRVELQKLVAQGMKDKTWNSPFAQEARENGMNASGGRKDSYTVIITVVLDSRTRGIPDVWSMETLDANLPVCAQVYYAASPCSLR